MYYLEDRHPEFEYGCYIKVGNAMPHTFATVDEIDAIISDNDLDENIKKYFIEKNIEIL